MSMLWASTRPIARDETTLRRAVEIHNEQFHTNLEVVQKDTYRTFYGESAGCEFVVRDRNSEETYELGFAKQSDAEWSVVYDKHAEGNGLEALVGEDGRGILSCMGAAQAEAVARKENHTMQLLVENGLLTALMTPMETLNYG